MLVPSEDCELSPPTSSPLEVPVSACLLCWRETLFIARLFVRFKLRSSCLLRQHSFSWPIPYISSLRDAIFEVIFPSCLHCNWVLWLWKSFNKIVGKVFLKFLFDFQWDEDPDFPDCMTDLISGFCDDPNLPVLTCGLWHGVVFAYGPWRSSCKLYIIFRVLILLNAR